MASDLPAFKRARCEAAYNGRYADMVFIVGPSSEAGSNGNTPKQFHVTRALFAMASDAFDAMLYRADSELEFAKAPSEVRILDVSPETFDQVSRHVHGLNAELTVHNVLEVLRAADKYQMPELLHYCKSFVRSVKTEGSLAKFLELLQAARAMQRQHGPVPDCVAHVVAVTTETVASCGPHALEHELANGPSIDEK